VSETPVLLDMAGPAHGGQTVARLDGQVVFVRGALPGESGVPVVLDPPTKKSFRTGQVADVAAIAAPSPHRVDPQDPATVAGAGCSDLDIVDVAGSLELKRQVVLDQFARIGHLDFAGELADVPVEAVSPEPFTGYRTRVRLGVDGQGRAGLRRAASHDIVALTDIPGGASAQWSPALADGLAGELAAVELTPGAEVCVAVGDDGVRSAVELTTTGRGRRRASGRRVLTGTGTVTHTVNGVSWTVPVEAFWQAHQGVPALYSDWIADALADDPTAPGHVPGERGACAWDLYGGAGVFAAALTDAVPGLAVDSVDVESEAVAAGRAALDGRDIRFVAGDVAKKTDALRSRGGLEAVVLDPPRTGADKSVLAAVVKARPRHILHIGCDPATAARDAARLVAGGYRPAGMTVVDAFGLTHHVEVLLHLVAVTGDGDGTVRN
jgi:tRNA/tmRNA/rRNA uracil-C5-methylase (TrmA/RlmC/RlmD family)